MQSRRVVASAGRFSTETGIGMTSETMDTGAAGGRGRLVLVALLILLLVSVGATLGLKATTSDDLAVGAGRGADQLAEPDPVSGSPLPGMVPVLDSTGAVRGFIPKDELGADPTELKLGAGEAQVLGWEVRLTSGELSGYMLAGYGFVDALTAQDDAIVEALLANPLQVVDEGGELVSAEEWLARTRAGTAATR